MIVEKLEKEVNFLNDTVRLSLVVLVDTSELEIKGYSRASTSIEVLSDADIGRFIREDVSIAVNENIYKLKERLSYANRSTKN